MMIELTQPFIGIRIAEAIALYFVPYLLHFLLKNEHKIQFTKKSKSGLSFSILKNIDSSSWNFVPIHFREIFLLLRNHEQKWAKYPFYSTVRYFEQWLQPRLLWHNLEATVGFQEQATNNWNITNLVKFYRVIFTRFLTYLNSDIKGKELTSARSFHELKIYATRAKTIKATAKNRQIIMPAKVR